MNSNKKYDFYKNGLYFLIANAVLLVAGIVILSIFGFNVDGTISGGKLLFQIALMSVISLVVVFVYVGIRYDYAKAFTIVVTSLMNMLICTALIIVVRIPVTDILVAVYGALIALTTVFTILLTDKAKDANLKKTDYSEVIKNTISKSIKQIFVFSAVVIALLFLSLIIASKDTFNFARLFFVMFVVVLYSSFTVKLPLWIFFSSKMQKIKKAKADQNVENQKVIKAVQTEEQTNENN